MLRNPNYLVKYLICNEKSVFDKHENGEISAIELR